MRESFQNLQQKRKWALWMRHQVILHNIYLQYAIIPVTSQVGINAVMRTLRVKKSECIRISFRILKPAECLKILKELWLVLLLLKNERNTRCVIHRFLNFGVKNDWGLLSMVTNIQTYKHSNLQTFRSLESNLIFT
jgi:hypothetical protein